MSASPVQRLKAEQQFGKVGRSRIFHLISPHVALLVQTFCDFKLYFRNLGSVVCVFLVHLENLQAVRVKMLPKSVVVVVFQ